MSEAYEIGGAQPEVYTFGDASGGEVVCDVTCASVVEPFEEKGIDQSIPPIESYSFYLDEIEIKEFESGPPGPAGKGIPEVFIGESPATLVFTPVTISGEEVLEMEVTAS